MSDYDEDMQESIEIVNILQDYFDEMMQKGILEDAWTTYIAFLEGSLCCMAIQDRKKIKDAIIGMFKVVGDEIYEDMDDYLTHREEKIKGELC